MPVPPAPEGFPTAPGLPPGTQAPDFTLPSTLDRDISLHDYRDQPVVLAFYPADWTPVCGDQLSVYSEIYDEFEAYHAQLLGISVDSVWSHKAWAKEKRIRFPLLSDYEPKGEVCRRYRVYREGDGYSERALFVLDPKGVIFWSHVSPLSVNPGADGILQALEAMTTTRPRQAVPA